jgi:hypothetical protein
MKSGTLLARRKPPTISAAKNFETLSGPSQINQTVSRQNISADTI